MTQSPPNNKIKDNSRLVYFDYFRGIAILVIILGHCFNAWPRNQAWETTLVNLISGGTALFVFISGFFFHHVYYRKYHYWSFIKNKTKYVFAPYLILSLLYMAYYYVSYQEIAMTKVLNQFFGPDLGTASLIVMNVLTGRTLWAYWYIPFAMLLFLLSPVFIRFIRLSLASQLIITASLFTVSMFAHRPSWEINPIHSLIYYMPYYLLGMIYSLQRAEANQWLLGKTVLLLFTTIAVAFGMVLLGQTDNLAKTSIFSWQGIDLMIFQKLSLIAFMLAFTMHLQQYKMPLLSTMAEMSFALYFLHQWALSFMRRASVMDFSHEFGGVILLFLAATLLSYLLAQAMKPILGKTSRYIIGW